MKQPGVLVTGIFTTIFDEVATKELHEHWPEPEPAALGAAPLQVFCVTQAAPTVKAVEVAHVPVDVFGEQPPA